MDVLEIWAEQVVTIHIIRMHASHLRHLRLDGHMGVIEWVNYTCIHATQRISRAFHHDILSSTYSYKHQ